jgi:hypothetical protein
MHAKRLDRVFSDIKNAKSSIIIVLTPKSRLSDEWINTLENTKSNVKVKIYGPTANLNRSHLLIENTDIVFPLIILDEQIIWLGHPLENVKNSEPPSIAVRAVSNHLSSFFIKQLPGQLR